MRKLERGGSFGAALISRRDFLRVGGTGLAGTALLGSGTVAGCGIFQQQGGQGGGGGGKNITVNLQIVVPIIKGFWYHTYGGSLDLKLYRVSG